jgi:hypothetical protein
MTESRVRGEILLVLFGFAALLFRSRISQSAMKRWERPFPAVRIPLWTYDVAFLVVGIVFTTVGMLAVFGVIHFR